MDQPILSVSEFVDLVNQTLEFAFGRAVIEGEVAEFEVKQSKWVHFKLKDSATSIDCFMTVWGMRLPIEDGMKLKMVGYPKLTQWGRFSFNVQAYELAGAGALAKAYELLKQQLDSEGLFETARKRSLPLYPQTIGLITSIESEAYKDFVTILNERWRGVKVVVTPVQVQGLAAPDQIVAALDWFNQLAQPVDVVVLVRGGGSAEDLQAFSSEPVVRAVAASRTPTLVGVGHEGDISLADLAADLRASTPTDAARKVVPNQVEVLAQIDHLAHKLHNQVSWLVSANSEQLMSQIQALDRFMRQPADQLINLSNRLNHRWLDTSYQITTQLGMIDSRQAILINQARRTVQDASQQLTALNRTLISFDPLKTLKRGYAIVRQSGRIIKSGQGLKEGDELMLQLAQDQLTAEFKRAQT